MSERPHPRKQNYQNIAWFNDLKNRDLLDMSPPYQRWSVWNLDFKQRFIETLLLGYPSPAIFLFRKVSETGETTYEVVDGKQRLTAIFEFLDNEIPISEKSLLMNKRGKYFRNLDKDERIAFWDYDISVEYLPTNNETVINDIFDRLNRNTARLTAQELRHAKHSGDFINAGERLANWTWSFGNCSDDESAETHIPKVPRLPSDLPRIAPQSRRQMKDVEIVATLLLYLEEGVKGYSREDLDGAFSSREEWEDEARITDEYRNVITTIDRLAQNKDGRFILQSRLRNQADFYSFFAAIADLRKSGALPNESDLLARLKDFLEMVDETGAGQPEYVSKYYDAARSASNDTGPRRERIKIIKNVMLGTSIDAKASAENVP